MGDADEDIRGGGDAAMARVATRGSGAGSSVTGGFGCDTVLLLDMADGGRQLPKTASPKADAVGDGIEYSDTDTEGRPEGTDIDMDGRAPL